MKFRSKQQKPATGMELSVTLSLSPDQTVGQSRESIIKFFEIVTTASKELGSNWLRVNCSGIPEELEPALQAAFVNSKPPQNLKLVVDNTVQENSVSESEKR